jgi:membrane protein implicated in regulation of membrane protease activity
MALVVGFILFVVLGPPLGVVALGAGALIEVGELFFWTRFLRRYRVQTGPEALIGARGTALEGWGAETEGQVLVRGERWRARLAEADGEVGAGSPTTGCEVEVVGIDGLTLSVRSTGRAGSRPRSGAERGPGPGQGR